MLRFKPQMADKPDQEKKEITLFQPGEYDFFVKWANVRPSKNGNEMIEMLLLVHDKEGNEIPVKTRRSLPSPSRQVRRSSKSWRLQRPAEDEDELAGSVLDHALDVEFDAAVGIDEDRAGQLDPARRLNRGIRRIWRTGWVRRTGWIGRAGRIGRVRWWNERVRGQ